MQLSSFVCLCVLVSVGVTNGFQIQIYRHLNYKGLIYENEAADKGCHNVKPYARGIAGSVRLNKCVITYESLDCQGFSQRLEPNTDNLGNLMKPIFSYSACNSTYGGDTILVNFYKNNELLAEYQNICGCQDLPSEVSSNALSLLNHGNCVKIYQTDSCGGKSSEIVGGVNEDSRDLTRFDYFPRSISACGSRPSCVKLNSQVYKFVLLPDENIGEDDMKQVELAAKTTFYNNGSATVTQQYMASKTLKEVYSITRSKTVTKMETSTVEKTVEAEVKVGFWFLSASVKTSLTEAYTMTNTEENKEEETFTKEEEKTFAVTQTIQIPPCAQYQVSSMVSIIENLPVQYEVYTKITGSSSGLRMTSEQIQAQVTDMIYVGDHDEFTAIYKSEHMLLANVGVDTWITGEGTDIEGCVIRRD